MACSWYDLDQHEVLDLKGRILEAAGASKKHGQQAKYPLHAGSYTSAVVDLNSPSWTETLINAGETAEGMHEDCTCCQCGPMTPPRLCGFQACQKEKWS
jgi:O-methyltransferase involved in polyketide biosynthesis